MRPDRPSHFQKVQQKRYAARAFRNPYFQPRERPRWIPLVASAAALLLVLSGLWAGLTLPAFAITSIRVEGNETIATDALAATVQAYLDEPFLWAFKRSNRFLFQTETLKSRLNAAYAFDAVSLDRTGGLLDVRVRERESELLWRTGPSIYLIDVSGRALRALTLEETAGLTLPDPPPGPGQTLSPIARLKRLHRFTDVNQAPVQPNDQVLKPEEVTGAQAFEQRLLDQAIAFTDVRVDRQAGEWMSVKTLAGYDILFDPLQDAAKQAERLQALFHDTLKDVKGLTYVDLRFGDHVYYK